MLEALAFLAHMRYLCGAKRGCYLEHRHAIKAGGAGKGEKQLPNSLNCLLNHVIARAEDLKILEVFVSRRR
jgi:hypothetical protein